MAEYQNIRSVGAGARTAEIDEGLRAHMNKVYGLMSVGMLLTGGVAWAVGNNEALFSVLRNLDDAILRDIGLTRDAAMREAARGFWDWEPVRRG